MTLLFLTTNNKLDKENAFFDNLLERRERKRLAKQFGTSLSNANRLLKTEMSRIRTQTDHEYLKDHGFTHLIYVAEAGACPVCDALDGQAIPIHDGTMGSNLPPMHPNCRCSFYGHIKLDRKDGTSTLDDEDIKGVWGEENHKKGGNDSTSKSVVSQLTGQRHPEISSHFHAYPEFKKDIANAFKVLENNSEITRTEVRKLFKDGYYVGKLIEHDIFGEYQNKNVVLPDHMIAYALTKHRNQIKLNEFLKIDEVITSPDFVSEDIRGKKDTFLLNKKISGNRYLEAGIEDKDGQFVFHFMLRDEKKNNKRLRKIINKVEKYDILDKKVYNVDKE